MTAQRVVNFFPRWRSYLRKLGDFDLHIEIISDAVEMSSDIPKHCRIVVA